MYLKISDEERERAIQHIIENVPKKTLLQIYKEASKDPDWLTMQHLTLGISILRHLHPEECPDLILSG